MTQSEVTILRRVKEGEKYVETKEKAILVKTTAHASFVRLSNGDVIRRKNKDVLWEK